MAAATAKSASRPCPICKKPSVDAFRPFCSERCRDVDLNRWLSGTYAIPAEPVAETDLGQSTGEDEDGDT